ncbi:MAG: protein-disulfide reductase DsbD N-terminal domain-containing protein [Alistipes sp.]|nr:protein-disulfide reductase DsbD N-terminal domain-containing protein [Alistipes sp.]
MKKLLFALICFMLAGCSSSCLLNTDGKATLKVLYVGGAAEFETFGSHRSKEGLEASALERTAAWEAMLKEHFDSVATVQGKDYTPAMSEGYDVTIIDGPIPTMRPRELIRDAAGKVVKVIPAQRLPEDFSGAVVSIGQQSENIGRSIGTKLDWYCLCLDAEAHGMVLDHPIFKGPFKTEISLEKKPVPEDAKHYVYFTPDMPDSVMMWRVQTKGYQTDEGFPVGMVSRPWGFLDGPDTEFISSGVCAKTIDAVAIGRHGNYLHWGFAASPAFMTEEAKAVFANAVCYIAQFKGQTPLVRKYNDRIATREYIKELIYMSSMEPYETRVGWTVSSNEEGLKKQDEVRAKKARGEKLTAEESYYLNFKPSEPMTLAQYLQRYHKQAYVALGEDLDAYVPYYEENTPYFYGGEGMYVLTIDEDAKAWGIPTGDIRLLEKAIRCLEKGEEVERAQRILDRYTLCTFETPTEWSAWFKKYRKKIFFTEAGGWFYMVDGPATLPGNDYKAREKKAAAAERAAAMAAQPGETSAEEPVAVAARVVKANGSTSIEVNMKIHPGFHVYRAVAASDAYLPVKFTTQVPADMEASEVIFPTAKPFGTAGTTIYEDAVTFVIPLTGQATGEVSCKVEWQCCDAHVCMPPMERELKLTL